MSRLPVLPYVVLARHPPIKLVGVVRERSELHHFEVEASLSALASVLRSSLTSGEPSKPDEKYSVVLAHSTWS